MTVDRQLSVVVVSNDRDVLGNNLLASPTLGPGSRHQLIVQEGFSSAAEAYNEALPRCAHEVVVFIHQDVFLPANWMTDLEGAIAAIETDNPNWGVLGCYGMTQEGDGAGYLFTVGEGVIGDATGLPRQVQTLDELVLVIRRDSGLRFNEGLAGFHFYGTDLCLSARKMGLSCYAISAFCIHNTRQYFALPPDFYRSYWSVKKFWREALPIQTSCIRITRFDEDLWLRRLKEAYRRVRKGSASRGPRPESPLAILEELRANHSFKI